MGDIESLDLERIGIRVVLSVQFSEVGIFSRRVALPKDFCLPSPIEIDYPVLLDSPAPHLRAYPIETVVAEKFQAMVMLGIANSRLKDYYDLWLISRTFELDNAALSLAVQRTFERRQTSMPADVPMGLTRLHAEEWDARWKTFLNREHMNAVPAELNQVLEDLRRFLVPLMTPSNTSRCLAIRYSVSILRT